MQGRRSTVCACVPAAPVLLGALNSRSARSIYLDTTLLLFLRLPQSLPTWPCQVPSLSKDSVAYPQPSVSVRRGKGDGQADASPLCDLPPLDTFVLLLLLSLIWAGDQTAPLPATSPPTPPPPTTYPCLTRPPFPPLTPNHRPSHRPTSLSSTNLRLPATTTLPQVP
jgi:hypothetical protein